MYVDDLPVWGMVGEIYEHPTMNDDRMEEEKTIEKKYKNKGGSGSDQQVSSDASDDEEEEPSPFKLYVYTRKIFSIAYNHQRIVEVNLTSEDPMLVQPGVQFDFHYDVQWIGKYSCVS